MRQSLLTLTLILFSLLSFCQGFNERHPDIQFLVDKINNATTSMESVTIENEELMAQMTDGGGELTGYFSNGEIQKMELRVSLSYGVNEFEFFYKNSKLYFVFETFRQFSYNEETGSLNYSKTDQTFTGNYLFTEPFDYETLGRNRFENDELDPEKILTNEAGVYLKLLDVRY